MIPDPPGGVGRDREPAGRGTTTAPTGLAGEADGGRLRARRGGGGDRDPVGKKTKPGRARARKRGGRGGRGRERRRRRARSSPSRDVRGDAPRTHDAREGRTSGTGRVIARSPRRRHRRRELARTRGEGYLTAGHPTRCGWRFPTRETRAPFPEDDGAGRVPRRTSADGPTVADADPRTSAKPLSLARFPETRRGLLFSPARTDPPPRQTRPPPPKDLRRRRAPTRPATRRRRPTAVSPKAAPEREVTSPRRQNRIPGPEEGRVTAAPRSWERCRGEGERGDSTRHAARATHARDAHGEAADAGTAKTGKSGRDRSRRTRTVDGWGPGAHRHPAPLFPLGSTRPEACAKPPPSGVGDSGSRGTRACAQRGPLPSPTTGVTTSQAPARRHAGTPASRHALFRPAWFLPGLGAGRRGPQRSTQTLGFPPLQKSGRGEGNPARATRIGRATGRAGATQPGPTGDPKHALSSDR